MKRVKYEPRPEVIVSAAEVAEAMALLRGEPVLTFELPAPTLIRDGAGGFHVAMGHVWVKLSVSFREVMPKLKGAPLAVFLSICLHVNGEGDAWPEYDTICTETGYERAAVARAIKYLEAIPGLLTIVRRDGTSNLYRPAYIAYGKDDPLSKANLTPYQKRTRPPIKSELKGEPLSRTKKENPAAPNPPNATVSIQAAYESLLGEKLDSSEWTRQEGAAAKRIGAKYTPEQLRRAYQHYKTEVFWSDKRLTLNYLSKNMGTFLASGGGQGDGNGRGPMLPEGLLDG